MKTAQEVISDIQQLSMNEKQTVIDYVISEENSHPTPVSVAELHERYQDYQRGENCIGPFQDEEANKYLRKQIKHA